MLRRIMITFAAAGAAFTLATAPAGAVAGAGAGSLEVYSAPSYDGTRSSVPSATVEDYVNECVPVSALTGFVLISAQSVENYTRFSLRLYGAPDCTFESEIVTVSASSSWTTLSDERFLSVFVEE